MDRTRLGIRFAILFLAVAYPFLSGPSHVFSQEGANPDYGEAMITMDFQDVDLTVLIKFISELTGKNFILDEKTRGKKVTVISPTKISKDEAYKVFESILEIKGLATVPAGSVIKIVPTKDAMEKSLRTIVGKERAPDSDMLITRLVSLEYVDPGEMVKILKPLMSRSSKVDAYGPTNTLILTETSSNITRLLRIVKQLDIRADEMAMDVIPLEYASAEPMARQLQEILQTLASSTAPGAAPTAAKAKRTTRRTTARKTAAAQGFSGKIIADDRTNSLIVLASETQLEEIRELIHKLDYDTPRAYGNINVYYLEYSNAEDTATVLSDLVSGARSLSKNGSNNKQGTPPRVARTMASFEGEVSITADIATNSLILVATPRDYLTLKNVIEKLDIRRKQVYVEAVIMEIQPSVLQDLGIEWRGAIPLEGGDDVNKVLMGGTNYGLGANELIGSATALASGTLPTGDSGMFPLDLGSRTGLTLGGIFDRVKVGENPSTGDPIYLPANTLMVHALNQTNKANLLSTPHLIAMDNEEAEIVVGKNVPFITSTSQSTVSTVQSVQRENVGITLRFTPQITEGDYIQLALYQEISSLIDSPVGQDPNRVGPTTSERKVTNTVLVRDGQTIIVGGLMEDRIRTSVSKVPWLGDIPVLGWFFRFESDTVEKQNLLIFLTPTIIREDQDVQRLFEEKKNRMLEYKDRHDLPVEYMDVRPFEGRSGAGRPGDSMATPQLEELEPPPAEKMPDEGTPVDDTPLEDAGQQGANEPTYEVTIKGADRLDSPALPDLPDE